MTTGGDGGAGMGGLAGAAWNAGAEPEGACGPGEGAAGERGPALRRSKLPWMPSAGCFEQYAAVAQLDISPTLDQALSGPHALQWREAMHAEIVICERMCMCKRTTLPPGRQVVCMTKGSGLQVGDDHEEECNWRN